MSLKDILLPYHCIGLLTKHLVHLHLLAKLMDFHLQSISCSLVNATVCASATCVIISPETVSTNCCCGSISTIAIAFAFGITVGFIVIIV